METLRQLQAWYFAQCNEDWEHTFGVKIDTLDNPGWLVTIDLAETELLGIAFEPVVRGSPEGPDWVHCKVDGPVFQGAGGPFNLEEVLQAFPTWAAKNAA